MTDLHNKRKYAGPTINERRKVDQDPARVPPHKKPRNYKLTVTWTTTRTWSRERVFTSKAARDEARVRIERHFAEVAAREAQRKAVKWNYFHDDPFAEFDDVCLSRIKEGPYYAEEYEA